MKTTTPKRKPDNVVRVVVKARTPRPMQRSAIFRSGKQYSRKGFKPENV